MTAHILSVILALGCLVVGVGAGSLLGEKISLTREIAQERADLAHARGRPEACLVLAQRGIR